LKCAGIKGARLISATSGELSEEARRPQMSALDNGRYQKAVGDRMRGYKEALREYIAERRG